jgi:hypothetical protein
MRLLVGGDKSAGDVRLAAGRVLDDALGIHHVDVVSRGQLR